MAHAQTVQFTPGNIFNDRYQIVRHLSVGGMGAVYEAIHLETRRRRALKLMHPELTSDPVAKARFRLEAQVAANIESEHIVEVLDAGVDPQTNIPFIVMELLIGQDLGAVIAKRKRLQPDETIDYLAQVARALVRTHAAGIIHRDLKPENLFLTTREDGTPRIKVLDFGIAKVVAENRNMTRATATLGTPVFMAPEQISGASLDGAADNYALAHIAYNMLCGSAYWDKEADEPGGVYALLVKVAAGAREPATARAVAAGVTLPRGFETWFRRATALRPKDRFQSAAEVVTALAATFGLPQPIITNAPRRSPLDITLRPPNATDTTAISLDGATTPHRRIPESSLPRAAAFAALFIGVFGVAFLTYRLGPSLLQNGGSTLVAASAEPSSSDGSGEPNPSKPGTPNPLPTTTTASEEPPSATADVKTPPAKTGTLPGASAKTTPSVVASAQPDPSAVPSTKPSGATTAQPPSAPNPQKTAQPASNTAAPANPLLTR